MDHLIFLIEFDAWYRFCQSSNPCARFVFSTDQDDVNQDDISNSLVIQWELSIDRATPQQELPFAVFASLEVCKIS